MIKSFKHNGLELFFETGTTRGILSNASDVKKIYHILTVLDRASVPEDMNLPQFRFHKLKGKLKNYHAVKVNANWRIIFEFNKKDVYNVNLIDYH